MQDCSLTLPAKSLAVKTYPSAPGEKSEPLEVLPQAGDPVDFHVKGTVQAVENGTATVHVAFVNGERVEKPAAPKPAAADEDAGDNEETLRKLAGAADEAAESENYI